jgi:high-affinity Fe2+/Pb2+ permease
MHNAAENRLAVLETRLETILPTLATKGDVSEMKASLVMWLGTIVAASTAIVIAVLLFAINRVGG